jgi:hypothetical protein
MFLTADRYRTPGDLAAEVVHLLRNPDTRHQAAAIKRRGREARRTAG